MTQHAHTTSCKCDACIQASIDFLDECRDCSLVAVEENHLMAYPSKIIADIYRKEAKLYQIAIDQLRTLL